MYTHTPLTRRPLPSPYYPRGMVVLLQRNRDSGFRETPGLFGSAPPNTRDPVTLLLRNDAKHLTNSAVRQGASVPEFRSR